MIRVEATLKDELGPLVTAELTSKLLFAIETSRDARAELERLLCALDAQYQTPASDIARTDDQILP